MKLRALKLRSALLATAIVAAAVGTVAPSAALAQERPKDLTAIPPVPTTYVPKKTAWGDPDFRGTWPIENLADAHILFQRPKEYGNRQWVTDEEFQRRLDAAKRSDGNYKPADQVKGVGTPGTQGLADWVQHSSLMHRTGMVISPANGQLPPLTPKAQKLFEEGRSSWVPNQEFFWVDDFDTWDRCISRGFPASMFPFRYNNGIRVFQSPGYVVIELEMLGTRVIPISNSPNYVWPKGVEAWMGDSRGHWEGNTLVIETSNIKSGDSATHDEFKRAAAPVNVATQNAPPFNTTPTSPQAHTVERITMTGPNTITYQVTYTDPEVYTVPWTARLEWARNDKYQFFEYACHEGDEQVRNYIIASKAHLQQIKEGKVDPTKERDARARFAQQFDYDPGTGPRPGAPPGGGRGGGAAGAGAQNRGAAGAQRPNG